MFVLLSLLSASAALTGARGRYFLRDEWIFLADRRSSLGDAVDDVGGHLVALPFLVFRILFSLFGIRSYVPYLLVAVLLHLIAAALLREVMRRAEVRIWLATLVATLFLFFGNGRENIVWAFQMTLTGSLVFGLTQLILSDHNGSWDSRDWLGLGAGIAGMLCSNLALSLIVAVGLTTLSRRGLRTATLHTAPIGFVFVVWSIFAGPDRFGSFSPTFILEWSSRSFATTLSALGSRAPVGWVLAVVLGIGLIGLSRHIGVRHLLTGTAALPLSLLAASVFFVASTAAYRSFGGTAAASSERYLYVCAALILPALGLALEVVMRAFESRRLIISVVALPVVFGLVGNAIELARPRWPGTRFFDLERQWVSTLPRAAEARNVNPGNRPEPNQAPWVTVGWLLEAQRDGRLPPVPDEGSPTPPRVRAMLLLNQRSGSVAGPCTEVQREMPIRLLRGSAIELRGPAAISVRVDGRLLRNLAYGSTFWDSAPQRLESTLRDLTVRISNRPGASLTLCGPSVRKIPASGNPGPGRETQDAGSS